jgi:hypothetical protein
MTACRYRILVLSLVAAAWVTAVASLVLAIVGLR